MNTACNFKLDCVPSHWLPGANYFVARHDRAVWQFEDGVTVTAIERHEDRRIQLRGRYSRSVACATQRELTAKARIYVSTDAKFDVLEDLTNRRSRPHNVWKPRVVEALARIGVEFDYIGWSQTAGCSCGCSPAFVPRDADALRRWDFWVTLPGAPTTIEAAAA